MFSDIVTKLQEAMANDLLSVPLMNEKETIDKLHNVWFLTFSPVVPMTTGHFFLI